MRQNCPRLSRIGELEKYIGYGLLGDGDGVLVTLDADEDFPKRVMDVWIPRITAMRPLRKKIGVALFRSEFECMFLYCLDNIAEKFLDYGWDLDGGTPTMTGSRWLGPRAHCRGGCVGEERTRRRAIREDLCPPWISPD